MKRLLALMTALLLLLCACGGSSVPDTLEVSGDAVEIQTEEDVKSILENIFDTAKVEMRVAEDDSESAAGEAGESAPATSTAASGAEPESKAPLASQSTAAAAKEETLKPSSTVFDDEVGDIVDSAGKVTVSIDCSAAVGKSDKAASSGWFLRETETEIDSSDTVFTATLRACAAGGIDVTYRASSYGNYIEAIEDLYEFDCGAQSGWMVYVNGVLISVSADSETVSDGDEIEWVYVTEYTS